MKKLVFSPESRLFYKNRLLLLGTVVSYYHDYQTPRQACAADQLVVSLLFALSPISSARFTFYSSLHLRSVSVQE